MRVCVTATRSSTYEVVTTRYKEDDPDGDFKKGVYAFVGAPGDQSDFVTGPWRTPAEAVAAATRILSRRGYRVRKVR